MTPDRFTELYASLVPTNKRVVNMMQFPEPHNPQASEVIRHMKRYIKDLDERKLQLFLRFCTGSDLLTIPHISLELTHMSGFERRPIAHTCGCVLQIADHFDNFMEFRSEFDNVLESQIWIMDII